MEKIRKEGLFVGFSEGNKAKCEFYNEKIGLWKIEVNEMFTFTYKNWNQSFFDGDVDVRQNLFYPEDILSIIVDIDHELICLEKNSMRIGNILRIPEIKGKDNIYPFVKLCLDDRVSIFNMSKNQNYNLLKEYDNEYLRQANEKMLFEKCVAMRKGSSNIGNNNTGNNNIHNNINNNINNNIGNNFGKGKDRMSPDKDIDNYMESNLNLDDGENLISDNEYNF